MLIDCGHMFRSHVGMQASTSLHFNRHRSNIRARNIARKRTCILMGSHRLATCGNPWLSRSPLESPPSALLGKVQATLQLWTAPIYAVLVSIRVSRHPPHSAQTYSDSQFVACHVLEATIILGQSGNCLRYALWFASVEFAVHTS